MAQVNWITQRAYTYQRNRKTQTTHRSTMTSIRAATTPRLQAAHALQQQQLTNSTTAALYRGFFGGDGKTPLLIISLTIHACTLGFLISRAGFGAILSKKGDSGNRSLRGRLAALHNKQNWILPKLLTEQLVTLVLIIMAIVDVGEGDMLTYPFVPLRSRNLELTGIVYCMNMGKYIYKSIHEMMLNRHLMNFKVDILHHSVTLCCYAVFFTYQENLFLGLIGIVMESDLLCNEIVKIHKLMSCDKNSTGYKILVVFSMCMTILCRGIIPVTFLITSLASQSVMSMNFVSIIFWFLGLVFFLAISVWLMVRSGVRMRKTLVGHPHPVNINDFAEIPHCGEQNSQEETTSGPITPPVRQVRTPERVIPLQYKNDLSYLSPYSNVNINSAEGNSKLNLFNKKVTAKDTLNNLSVLFAPNPVRFVHGSYHRQREQRTTPGTLPRAVRDSGESRQRSPLTESAVETRVDEPPNGVPRVVISGENQQSGSNSVSQSHMYPGNRGHVVEMI